jgi:hypothetical protein
MRAAAKSKIANRGQSSSFKSIPAPVSGWNAIDAIADMKDTEALTLENWFPQTGYCEIRGGSTSHATGMTGNGKTLMIHNSITGTNKMFCSTASGVYNVSSAGAVGASVAARTNGKHQWTMFGDGTNQWLIAVNGVDKPLYYDGTTWVAVDGVSVPALTGLTTTTLVGLTIFKGRLMFLQNSSLAFWYLPSGVAGGLLVKFDLSGVAQMGGYLMAMASWTLDPGIGPDDRMVFVTSKGEVLLYGGSDPSSASTWGLVGIYKTGIPLGRKCIVKQGSDLVILTQSGAFAMNTITQATGSSYAGAVSRKIQTIFNQSATLYGSIFGWCSVVVPAKNAVVVNIPHVEDGLHEQYVMNTITLAWCKFTGWNAEDFAVFNDELYYCSGTSVIHAWTGVSDIGSNIVAYGKTAFGMFGTQTLKSINLMRPMLQADGPVNYFMDADVDFEDKEIVGNPVVTSSNSSLWDSGTWDSSLWGGSSLQIIKDWQSVNAWTGFYISGKIKVSTKQYSVRWLSTDYMYDTGGLLT